ncbi:MAG: electron transfer flavoprotein subunit beta/FixA family protein [Euryarchaeota archaeon]|nr:electron transfer flavoprotein subunit beta/FixA family protein [Euryarchaeota archaeon]
MNIVVCAKQVVDVSEIKIDPQTQKPIITGIAKKISDIDKNALEEGIRIKEKHGGKITVISVGSADVKERIKELLAMGADEGVLVVPPDNADYAMISHILAGVIKKIGSYDIVLCGEASIDMFSGQMGPRIAGFLGIPQITYAQKVSAEKDHVVSERNLGDKIVTMESLYPVLITVTKEINVPRLPSLMQILGSASKPLLIWPMDGVVSGQLIHKISTIDVKGVPMQRKNIVYKDDIDKSVEKLVNDLAKEGVLR